MGEDGKMIFGAATIGSSAATAPYAFVSPATRGLELKDTLAGWMCDPWECSLRALEAFFGLQDNWDGEGAAA